MWPGAVIIAGRRRPTPNRAQESATLPSSILVRPGDPAADVALAERPAFAADLHLDEVMERLVADRDPAARTAIEAPSFTRLHDPDAIAFRHEVFRDLEAPELRDAVVGFVDAMRVVDEYRAMATDLPHPLERQRWLLEAANEYQAAVARLAVALERAAPTSRALQSFADGLRGYVGSDDFAALLAGTRRLVDELATIRYRMRIEEHRVTVGRHDGEPDYGAEILETFARFRTAETVRPVPVDVFRPGGLNRVETGIVERVARLHPDVFRRLEAYARDHATFVDPGVATFASEITFYLAWQDLIAPLRAAGLPFCYPEVSGDDQTLDAEGLFDLALALRELPTPEIVTNDVVLRDAERILVVTGPNQGGKTVFARSIGQLVHLASVGVPVPGSRVRLALGDAVHTLFARSEDPSDLTGRLEAELGRARAILDTLGGGDLVIMNESFGSTTVEDALALNQALLGEIARRGAVCVVVTFLGELATFDPTTVSMSGVMDPDDPTRPTWRFERRPADDLAHARAVAEVHRLGYDDVRARIAP